MAQKPLGCCRTRRAVENGRRNFSRSTALTLADLSIYGGLFLSALVASTLLPISSEAVLAGLLATRRGEMAPLLVVATLGNTLGSVLNWLLGRTIEHFRERPWFPIDSKRYAAAERQFRRYGMWSLLFAWLPIVGDPLTLVAGALRVPFWPFLILVATGKAARYAALAAGVTLWMG